MGAKGIKGKGGKRLSIKSNCNIPTLRVLLLGSAGSGKSTFAKQIKHLNGGLTHDEYQTFRTIIHQNIIVCMQELLKQTEKQEDPVLAENHKFMLYVSEQQVEQDDTFDSSFANKVQTLYDDPAIQRVYAKCRYTHQSLLNFDYFIARLDCISQPAYVPTKDDVMVARQRTTGAQVTSFVKDGFNFNLVDVGGQRTERAKWQSIYEECRRTTAVLFFISLDEYNTLSSEEAEGGGPCTRLELARRVFVQLLRETLKDTGVVLFLNKYDVFVQKIKDDEQYADFKRVYPLYKGRQDPEECSNYAQARFVEWAMEEAEVDMEVHGYNTCALDTESVSNVFEAVKNDLYVSRMNPGSTMM